MLKNNLSKNDVLLCGLAFTSRTETLEEYLKDKVRSLTVVAISSCFLKENLSYCRVYENGILADKFKIPNLRIKDYKWYRQPLILLVFIINWLSIALVVLKLKKRFDLCIGISHSFTFMGVIFKKFRIVRKLLYYCIDYYIPQDKINFNSLFVRMINFIERFIVKNSDYVWDISPNIAEYRAKVGGVKKFSYKNMIVPLGYASHLKRFESIENINRWDIGFVGTITVSQGLQLLIESLPDIVKEFPLVRVKIIGDGPFLKELKANVHQRGLKDYFNFLGFIKEEKKMLDILSKCAIGVALWNHSIDDKNIICADPGKTKLYALCGLPMIVTKVASIADEVKRRKAGLVIEYDLKALIEAFDYLLKSDETLRLYRENAASLGRKYTSEHIFDCAFKEAFNIFNILE
ncbi:MAG: glycosyltransferase [Candidatus Omnitrophota bacterium]|nr:glycosyltransferase [Candidatus Omnitrophota bacterium]